MKIADQVCGIDSARRLKELGVKQSGSFWYIRTVNTSDPYRLAYEENPQHYDKQLEYVAAFSGTHLGMLLPFEAFIDRQNMLLTILRTKDSWFIGYARQGAGKFPTTCIDASEAEGRAKMVIFLIENKIIHVENIA